MTNRAAPADLWDIAKTLVNTLYSLFGEPQQIAACGAIDHKTFTWLTTWLRACETLLRRLLLIEAHALTLTPPPARGRSGGGQQPHQSFSLNPDDWRVRFTLLDRRRLAGGIGGSRTIAAGETSTHHSAWPLAHRAEALFRVCKNPLPYARRLARLIARIPKRVARILAPPHKPKRKSGDPPHIVDIIGRQAWAEIAALTPNTS
jgi:hypothetical protein